MEEKNKDAGRVMMSAHALTPISLSHPEKMRWMADYFLANYAPVATQPAQGVGLTDEQIDRQWALSCKQGGRDFVRHFARAILARQPAPTPIYQVWDKGSGGWGDITKAHYDRAPEEHRRTVYLAAPTQDSAQAPQETTPQGDEAAPNAAAIKRMVHDFPHLSAFHKKYALGPMLPPSCLCCGKVADEVAIKHAELPGIVVCRTCRDAALTAPQQPAAERAGYKPNLPRPIEYTPAGAKRFSVTQMTSYGTDCFRAGQAASRAAVPEGWQTQGWKIDKWGGAITVEHAAVGKAIVRSDAYPASDVVLYHLAETLLAAAPSPAPAAQEGEAGGQDSEMLPLPYSLPSIAEKRESIAAQQTSAQVDAKGGA